MCEPQDIWLGDVLRCADRLGPLDEAQQATVARLLGFSWTRQPKPFVDQQEPGRIDEAEEPEARPEDVGVPSQPRDGEPRVHLDEHRDPSVDRAVRRRLEPVGHQTRAPGESLESHPALPAWAADVHGRALPHEPLWNPRWTRQLVAAALSTPSTGRRIDVPRVVDTVARAQPLVEVPRVSKRTLVRGVQILVDLGDAMAPYARDRTQLVEQIGLVANHATSVVKFRGTPLRGSKRHAKPSWRHYTPPAPGTPVIALTDLRIGGTDGDSRAEDLSEWLDVAHRLQTRGSRLIALVPYGEDRWPRLPEALITIVLWDRAATVAGVLERVTRAERR